MDIVDAQLHVGPGMIDTTLEAMDSLGIRSVLIDEFWITRLDKLATQVEPGYRLANGAWRAVYPVAELASILHPDRFAFFVRLDHRDPQLESFMRVIAGSPHARAFRVLAVHSPEDAATFTSGGYEPLFDIAQDIGLPVCLFIPGYVEYLPRYLKKYPKLSFVVDHWGMGNAQNSTKRPDADFQRAMRPEYLDEILKLADHPNVAIKLSHAQMVFGVNDYPYRPLRTLIRRAIQAFGANRLIWASDKNVVRPPQTWSNLLHYLKDDPELSLEEKEWILGRSARRIFKWPAA
jgi:predicted TIM-barrel fold metal-dependent hydrolase